MPFKVRRFGALFNVVTAMGSKLRSETILERVPGDELTMGVYCIEGLAFEVK